MKLSSIQAIVFDARFPKTQQDSLSREQALLRYLQPYFRESLERLSVLGYTFFWLDEDRSIAENFLKDKHIFHFFNKIYALPSKVFPENKSFELLLREAGYLPQHILYLSFQLHSFYIVAKSIGYACFLFQEDGEFGSLRACLPKLYVLVPWLIKSKGLAPLYWSGPRQTVLQAYLGIGGLSPFRVSQHTRPLSTLVDQVLQKIQPTNAPLEEAILSSWEAIVGPRLASQSRPGRLVKGRQFVILAYNGIIRQELHFQAQSILKRVQSLPGGEQLVEISIQQRG